MASNDDDGDGASLFADEGRVKRTYIHSHTQETPSPVSVCLGTRSIYPYNRHTHSHSRRKRVYVCAYRRGSNNRGVLTRQAAAAFVS